MVVYQSVTFTGHNSILLAQLYRFISPTLLNGQCVHNTTKSGSGFLLFAL